MYIVWNRLFGSFSNLSIKVNLSPLFIYVLSYWVAMKKLAGHLNDVNTALLCKSFTTDCKVYLGIIHPLCFL